MSRKTGLALLSCALLSSQPPWQVLAGENAVSPPLMLANQYSGNLDLKQYWVSEKLDGVRAFWNGKRMLSRSGHIIALPDWFQTVLPDTAVEGELWLGRGRFSEMSGLIHEYSDDDPRWRQVKYMLFDMPQSTATFGERMQQLQRLAHTIDKPWVRALAHRQVSDEQALFVYLQQVVDGGGEGLMLNRAASYYQAKRTDELLKLKKYQDDEATVVAWLPGTGKYQGMMGSLLVTNRQGQTFAIGTGFNDEQRRSPPAIGSLITYRYSGLTANGLPRFARFLHRRQHQ